MWQRIRQWSVSRRKKQPRRPATDNAAPSDALARVLPELMQRAAALGRTEQCERLTREATRLASRHPDLALAVAAMRLHQGDADSAIALLDAAAHTATRARLLRAACLVRAGRSVDAVASLVRTARRSDASPTLRRFTALLECEAGNRDDAIDLLRRNLRQDDDPWSLTTLLAIRLEHDDRREATDLARRALSTTWGPDARTIHFALRSLGERQGERDPGDSLAAAEVLADELCRQPHVIPALVRAREIEMDHGRAELLAVAIQRALPQLERTDIAMESLARLHLLLGDVNLAMEWAQRGRNANPMSASLTRLIFTITRRLGQTQPVRQEKAA